MNAQPLATIATICFDGFGDEDFSSVFTHADRVGIGDIEFNAWYARNLTPVGLASIVERCRIHGLRPAALQVSPLAPGPTSADLARETARWLWLIEAADILGVKVIKSTGSSRGTRGGAGAVIDLMRHVAPVAQEHDITVALENHAENELEHPDDYREIFSQIKTPHVGMCLDTGHFVASGYSPKNIADEFFDRVVHVDLKDCPGAGPPSFVRFGEGAVDFSGFIFSIVEAGYGGHIVVESPRAGDVVDVPNLRTGADLVHSFIQAPHSER